jgi:hypothetical protein
VLGTTSLSSALRRVNFASDVVFSEAVNMAWGTSGALLTSS